MKKTSEKLPAVNTKEFPEKFSVRDTIAKIDPTAAKIFKNRTDEEIESAMRVGYEKVKRFAPEMHLSYDNVENAFLAEARSLAFHEARYNLLRNDAVMNALVSDGVLSEEDAAKCRKIMNSSQFVLLPCSAFGKLEEYYPTPDDCNSVLAIGRLDAWAQNEFEELMMCGRELYDRFRLQKTVSEGRKRTVCNRCMKAIAVISQNNRNAVGGHITEEYIRKELPLCASYVAGKRYDVFVSIMLFVLGQIDN